MTRVSRSFVSRARSQKVLAIRYRVLICAVERRHHASQSEAVPLIPAVHLNEVWPAAAGNSEIEAYVGQMRQRPSEMPDDLQGRLGHHLLCTRSRDSTPRKQVVDSHDSPALEYIRDMRSLSSNLADHAGDLPPAGSIPLNGYPHVKGRSIVGEEID